MTQFTLHTLDLPTFANQIHRHTIGFDNLFNELNRNFANSKADNYPPHNVIRLDDQHHVIEIAIAGFEEDEIDVELKDSVLTIKGEKKQHLQEGQEFLHRGISSRDWERTFRLADNTVVQGATVKNGILSIALEHIVPEEKKPKKIAITFAK